MKLFVFLAILSLNTLAQAESMVGAVSAGMGGTGRAAIQSNESLYLNPASIALLNRFFAGASYQSGFTNRDTTRHTYSLVMTDATEGLMFPGSLGYRRHQISSLGSRYIENDFKVGLSRRLHSRLSMGVGFNHLIAENELSGSQTTQNNGDIGLLIGLDPNWGLGVTGENIIKPSEGVPDPLRRSSQIAIGTQAIFDHYLTVRYELLMPLYTESNSYLGHRAGLNVDLQSYFNFSMGYSVDDYRGQNWVSAGFGWMGPRLKLAYSYQNEQRQKLGDRHLVDLWMDI